MTVTRVTAVAALLCCAALALPGAASAWTATLAGGTLVVSGAGEASRLKVADGDGGADEVDVSDATRSFQPPVPAGCTEETNELTCALAGVQRIEVRAGEEADVVGNDAGSVPVLVLGEGGNDALTGGNGDDTLAGGAGDDKLDGGDSGDDRLDGGDGADALDGEDGVDALLGGTGADRLDGGDDPDAVDGGEGNDRVDASDGFDAATGGPGDDRLTAGDDGTALDGAEGNDVLTGDSADDVLAGGTGNDRLSADGGDDRLAGGDGDDTLEGEDDDDRLDGGAGADGLDGGDGDDDLSGAQGNDALTGGDGDDGLSGTEGDDTMDGGDGADAFGGGPGSDLVDYSQASDAVTVSLDGEDDDGASDEDDDVGADVERLRGTSNDDRLSGAAGAQVLEGGDGDDRLRGGPGPDTLIGGAGSDTARYDERRAAVTVTLGGGGADDGGRGERDRLDATVENVLGGRGDDRLTGARGVANRLDGRAGDDVLRVRDRSPKGTADRLVCGPGADRVSADRPDKLASDCEDREVAGKVTQLGLVVPRRPTLTLLVDPVRLDARGRGRVVLRCAKPGADPCRARLVLSEDGRRLARSSVRLRPGVRAAVRVRVSRSALRRLQRRGRRAKEVDVRLVAAGTRGTPPSVSGTLPLRYPRAAASVAAWTRAASASRARTTPGAREAGSSGPA